VKDRAFHSRLSRWDKDWIKYLVDSYVTDLRWSDYALNETPAHRVTVDGFWMYRYEVTAAQYRKFRQATGHPPPPEKERGYWGRQPDAAHP
jgi:formylglycine-generating enzyme required for sulfatase activity